MLKYVYALISSADDFYTEQALVSMHSLRLHNPGCHIILVTDDDTLNALTGNRAWIKNYVDEYVIVNSPAGFSPKQKSRVLKTTLRQNIKGDFLFLDCDTVVMGSLEELNDADCDVAAVYAQHTNHWNSQNQHWHFTKYYKMREVAPDERFDINYHCNSGVMLCRDTEKAHLLFETWHKFWLTSSTQYGYHSDQCDLWRANASIGNIMTELNGIYNCQIIYTMNAWRYFSDCKILHYFNTSKQYGNLRIKTPEVLNKIREKGITLEIEEMLQTLKDEYLNSFKLLKDEALQIYNSPLVEFARNLSEKYPSLNTGIKFIWRTWSVITRKV